MKRSSCCSSAPPGSVAKLAGLEDYLVSCCLCHGIFFGPTESSDEKCQTWLPPAPTHLWPWPYQPWPSQRNQFLAFISGLFWRLQWRMKDIFFFHLFVFCLPTASTAQPVHQLFQWLLVQSWMGFKGGAVRGSRKGSYFHISALLD